MMTEKENMENTATESTDIHAENEDADMRKGADAAEAEKSEEKAPDLGKFKSAQALMEAYLALEAEFTRRSQRLKELEGNKAAAPPSPAAVDDDTLIAAALGSRKVRDAVVGQYLADITSSAGIPLVSGGAACAAPANAPRSVKEAGALARQFLKN